MMKPSYFIKLKLKIRKRDDYLTELYKGQEILWYPLKLTR